MTATKKEDGVVVHVLSYGRVLCGFSTELPKDWPPGNLWVGRTDLANVTCEKCHKAAEKLNDTHP